MAQQPTSEIIKSTVRAAATLGFLAGASWATSEITNTAELEEITTADEGTSASLHTLQVVSNHPFVPVEGVFRDDPTWDSFQESIRQYGEYIDALERAQE